MSQVQLGSVDIIKLIRTPWIRGGMPAAKHDRSESKSTSKMKRISALKDISVHKQFHDFRTKCMRTEILFGVLLFRRGYV